MCGEKRTTTRHFFTGESVKKSVMVMVKVTDYFMGAFWWWWRKASGLSRWMWEHEWYQDQADRLGSDLVPRALRTGRTTVRLWAWKRRVSTHPCGELNWGFSQREWVDELCCKEEDDSWCCNRQDSCCQEPIRSGIGLGICGSGVIRVACPWI